MMEFAIIAPVLVGLTFGVLNLGKALDERFRLQRVVYEGVRYAVSTSGLEQGTFSSATTLGSAEQRQSDLHARIRALAVENNLKPADLQFFSSLAIDPISGTRRVRIDAALRFEPYSGIFGAISIKCGASGDYLYQY